MRERCTKVKCQGEDTHTHTDWRTRFTECLSERDRQIDRQTDAERE